MLAHTSCVPLRREGDRGLTAVEGEIFAVKLIFCFSGADIFYPPLWLFIIYESIVEMVRVVSSRTSRSTRTVSSEVMMVTLFSVA